VAADLDVLGQAYDQLAERVRFPENGSVFVHPHNRVRDLVEQDDRARRGLDFGRGQMATMCSRIGPSGIRIPRAALATRASSARVAASV
jgi:hypothetical protein